MIHNGEANCGLTPSTSYDIWPSRETELVYFNEAPICGDGSQTSSGYKWSALYRSL